MLVLTRKKNQEICIGDDICLRVLRVQGGRVRIGITAPKHVQIVRNDAQTRLADASEAVGRTRRELVTC